MGARARMTTSVTRRAGEGSSRRWRVTSPASALAAVGLLACTTVNPAARPAPEAPAPMVCADAAPLATAPAEPAPTDRTEGEMEAPELEAPCRPGEPKHEEATALLDQLDEGMAKLGKLDDPAPLIEAVNAALGHPCLRHARRHRPRFGAADSGWALTDWWSRGGGHWLRHFLELTPEGPDGHVTRWFPVDPKKTLTQEHAPKHPLHPWLCSMSDPACQDGPAGWRRRATDYFRQYGEKSWWKQSSHRSPHCHRVVEEGPRDTAFRRWYDCEVAQRPKLPMLPLGGVRAPTEGWLTMWGRRGHHAYCDEIRAYDLKTGAAYLAQHCHSFVAPPPGTPPKPQPTARVGQVPVNAIREAAWAMVVADSVTVGRDRALGTRLPEGVAIGWPIERRFGRSHRSRPPRSDAQSRLSWAVHSLSGGMLQGELTWPYDLGDAAADHAVKLLRVAEEQLAEGCVPGRLPRLALTGTKAPTARQRTLRQALQRASATALRCP